MDAVSVEGYTRGYGRKRVLQACSLRLEGGTVYGLLGRNGSGKTTLLRRLIGLARGGSGKAQVLGQDLSTSAPHHKTHVAYVAQGEILPGAARVSALIAFERALRPAFDVTALERWRQQEGIGLGTPVIKMSGGQRKRLEVELALAAQPRVLLMDEPFEGIDPVGRAELTDRIGAYARTTGAAVLLSSHILGDLQRLCTRCGVLAAGAIRLECDMEALRTRYTLVSGPGKVGTPPCAAEVVTARDVKGADSMGAAWVLRDAAPDDLNALARQGYKVTREETDAILLELMRVMDARP